MLHPYGNQFHRCGLKTAQILHISLTGSLPAVGSLPGVWLSPYQTIRPGQKRASSRAAAVHGWNANPCRCCFQSKVILHVRWGSKKAKTSIACSVSPTQASDTIRQSPALERLINRRRSRCRHRVRSLPNKNTKNRNAV